MNNPDMGTDPLTQRRRRLIRRVILTVVTLAILIFAGAGTYVFNAIIVRKPPLSNHPAPDAPLIGRVMAKDRLDGLAWTSVTPHERWTMKAPDGVVLVGNYFPAEKPSKRTVILIHGHRSNAAMMAPYARLFRADGFNIFMADNRGHGASGGAYVGMGVVDASDYIGWARRIVAKTGADSNILLHGVSMGGSTVSAMSGRSDLPPQVKAGIDDCGFSSVSEELGHHINKMGLPAFPVVQVARLETRLLAHYDFEAGTPIEAVRESRIPLFFIHGAVDEYNPTWMGRAKFAAARSPKEIWIVPKADHGLSFHTDPAGYTRRVRAFYGRYL